MDTEKKYIEMCEKAEEIQEEWKPKRGDFYTVVVHGKATDITNIYIDGFPSLPQRFIPLSELYIWLPRQDQLQKMLLYKDLSPLALYMRLAEYIRVDAYYCRFASMEQLWLAFTMKQKYNKVWDEEKWVKDEL